MPKLPLYSIRAGTTLPQSCAVDLDHTSYWGACQQDSSHMLVITQDQDRFCDLGQVA